ncbi:MAG TPA: DUF1622 domain-containing protein [Candidatus Pullilachnospira intestinigallinarum]|nr:DUF1622 domain-containing protein [Candidatus Pullilachnospira intestinigallinarum]
MEQLELLLEMGLEHVVNLGILVFEFIGVAVILVSGIRGIIKWIRHAGDTRIYLAKGLAMGLEFKMGSEILRTVVVRQWSEIAIVAGIIALRAALSFLIHWEIKEEKKEELENEKRVLHEKEQ